MFLIYHYIHIVSIEGVLHIIFFLKVEVQKALYVFIDQFIRERIISIWAMTLSHLLIPKNHGSTRASLWATILYFLLMSHTFLKSHVIKEKGYRFVAWKEQHLGSDLYQQNPFFFQQKSPKVAEIPSRSTRWEFGNLFVGTSWKIYQCLAYCRRLK